MANKKAQTDLFPSQKDVSYLRQQVFEGDLFRIADAQRLLGVSDEKVLLREIADEKLNAYSKYQTPHGNYLKIHPKCVEDYLNSGSEKISLSYITQQNDDESMITSSPEDDAASVEAIRIHIRIVKIVSEDFRELVVAGESISLSEIQAQIFRQIKKNLDAGKTSFDEVELFSKAVSKDTDPYDSELRRLLKEKPRLLALFTSIGKRLFHIDFIFQE
jgi:hypothetical protein